MKASRKQAGQYARLITYALRQWPTLAGIVMLTLASSVIAILQPWPLKLVVDYALQGTRLPGFLESVLSRIPTPATTTLILLSAAASIGLFAINSALDTGLAWGWSSCGQRAVYDLMADLFDRLQRCSLLFHSKRAVGDSLTRLSTDAYCVYTATQVLLIFPIQHVLTLAMVGGVAWRVDPVLTAYTFVIAPMQAAVAFVFGRHLKRRGAQNLKAQSRLVSFVQQTLTAIPMVQAFGAEARNRQQFQNLADDAVAVSQRGTLVGSSYTLMNGLTTTIGSALVLYVGAQQVMGGTLSVGSLLVFLAYVRLIQGASQGLLGIYGNFKSVEASVDRVFDILEAEDPVCSGPGAKPLPILPPARHGRVRFENVSFGYEAHSPVLHDITLEACPGETVALVGPTGAGKSTLVSLIPRFFDPWQGCVIVNGVDIRDVQLPSLRAQVALVPQEPFLLPLTVAENIAYGRPRAGRQDIISAAVAANADEFIRELPEGYDTVIGERGARLSGGEKQRLAIARALLKDAPILILDEPTSSLDARTEALLLEALERLMVGRTTFIIAHRLSTIRRADKIVVLENGRLTETGTHRQLLAGNGHYHDVHCLQFRQSRSGVAR
jgi:ATP-binding cassette, subfamily B, bacterial